MTGTLLAPHEEQREAPVLAAHTQVETMGRPASKRRLIPARGDPTGLDGLIEKDRAAGVEFIGK